MNVFVSCSIDLFKARLQFTAIFPHSEVVNLVEGLPSCYILSA